MFLPPPAPPLAPGCKVSSPHFDAVFTSDTHAERHFALRFLQYFFDTPLSERRHLFRISMPPFLIFAMSAAQLSPS